MTSPTQDEINAANALAERIIERLDEIARDCDGYEFGLPWSEAPQRQMVAAILAELSMAGLLKPGVVA